MMTKVELSEIPIVELISDREAAIDDICACQSALKVKVETIRGVGVVWRRNQNIEQIKVIDAELQRRQIQIEGAF